MSRLHVAVMMAVAGLAMTAGCKLDPYPVVSRPDGSVSSGDGSGLVDGKSPGEGGVAGDAVYRDQCVSDPKGEICDGLDNDCNGKLDDVDASKLASDVKNCGACGNVCNLAHGFARCQDGKCILDPAAPCQPGFWDIDGKPGNGCEYACQQTNGGVEICDGLDNDCNKVVDDNFNLQEDENNCGSCGTVCQPKNGTVDCAGGKCLVTACEDGFKDLNKDGKDGCEYQCTPTAASDGCDGIDNDCDGLIDEDFVTGSPCYNGSSGCDVSTGTCKGECKMGTGICLGGYVACSGEAWPAPESCNGKDDDCDGVVDNGYDKQNDPRTCGGCSACSIPHAIAKCVNGTCAIAVCELGWVDLKNGASDGCEYKCTPTGVEICDGIDNDCNGLADTKDPGMALLGANPCASLGACQGATASCQGSSGWVCNYGPDVELKKCVGPADCGGGACVGGLCPGLIASQETRCDNKDNNCDGLIDETFPDKDKACAEPGKKGICQGKGTYACNAAGTATVCNYTTPGQSAKNEECNGLDDDCDGQVDEEADDAAGKGVVDAMVHVQRSVAGKPYDFYIYTYEASRPDASASSAGLSGARACSKPGMLPWASVAYPEAAAACAASGKRLCTRNEWEVACQGPSGTLYPYGASYLPQSCNGLDHAIGATVPSGSTASCVGGEPGLFDMSGNVREWTADQAGTTDPPDSKAIYVVRGGAYHTPAAGLTCTFDLSLAVEDVALPAIGFRCCSDTAP